jgi:hypothetical protein
MLTKIILQSRFYPFLKKSQCIVDHVPANPCCCCFSSLSQQLQESTTYIPDPSLVDDSNAPSDFHPSCAVVYRNFISETEADLIANDILTRMKRYVLKNSGISSFSNGDIIYYDDLTFTLCNYCLLLEAEGMKKDTGIVSSLNTRKLN